MTPHNLPTRLLGLALLTAIALALTWDRWWVW